MGKCIRCRKEGSIPGFCEECYRDIYGIHGLEKKEIPIEELKCRYSALEIIERDEIYSNEIRDSIIKEGLKNPLIVNPDGRIVIGHHRYFICKDLGYKTLPCYVINTKLNKFVEGGLNNIFIIKIDGKVVASITKMEDVQPILQAWIQKTPFWKTSHLVLEAFTGIGASNDPEHWKARNEARVAKLGMEKRLRKNLKGFNS